MSALRLLFCDTLRKDRLRLCCALFGIVAAIALLTWTLGLAMTTWWQGRPLSETMGKPFDCWVATNRASGAAPKGSGMQTLTHGSPIKMIPTTVAEAVLASPDIATCTATTVFRCRLDWRPEGRPLQGPGVGGGISPVRDFPSCPYPDGLAAGRWPQADAAEPEFVISPFAFGKDGLRGAPPVGTRLSVITPGGKVEATLCGYLAESIRPVSGFPTLFASNTLADAAALTETAGLCNLILIQLKPFHSPDRLAELVRTLAPDDDSARLITRNDLLKQLRSDAIQSLSRQVPLLVILACVATFCMIVNALCVGIEQNRRRYARLRALGMTAGQLVRLLLHEGIFLAFCGGVGGFLAGSLLLWLFVASRPLLFVDGLHLGWQTPISVFLLLALSAGAAFALPMRRIRTLSPCEIRTASEGTSSSRPGRNLLIALLSQAPVILTPFLFHGQPLIRSGWFVVIGLPFAIWGLMRIVRPLLWLCETCFAPLIGGLLRLRPELLRGALSRFADRNSRMVMTLATGLGAFFAIHLWGASLTDPFIPSRTFPDAIISLLPDGVSPHATRTLTTATPQGVTLTPFAAEQYCLHDVDFDAIVARTGNTPKQNNILLIGTEGEEGVTITAMFARQSGLKVGDTFRIQRKDRDGTLHTLPLTITHIRAVQWHLFTARSQLRARNGAPMGTLGPVFVGADVFTAWDPERTARTRFFWADLPNTAPTDDTELYSFSDRLELALQTMTNQDALEHPYRVNRFGKTPRPDQPAAAPAHVTVHLRDEISSGTLAHSSELLADLARIPLWSLFILCTGFISLLAANVRVMSSELKTLYAIGMTKGQMGRFLFAQALLLSICAILLALTFAFTVGWGFTGWTLAWMPFGGLPIALTIPWTPFFIGTAVLIAAVFLLTPIPIFFLIRRYLNTYA
ncbi:MAG: ABC transporter permease [Kiritimatiellae bacterium]|nr:ABC transporter permease [Kiritimatiellia bacterium]